MNNDFDMPTLKENEENVNNENNQNILQEKIEIPQEYYDKIAREKQQQIAKLEQEEQQANESKGGGSIFFQIVMNILIFSGVLYGMLNMNRLLIFGIPIYIVILTIISCITKKKETKYNITVLISGMLSAAIYFIIGMINRDNDIFIYFAFANAIIGFVGYIISTIITKILTDKENVKALQTLLYLLVLAAIAGVPYYLYTHYKEDFVRLVFWEKNVVIASTEQEFIESTLKYRYNADVTCDSKIKYYYDDILKRRINERNCSIGDNTFMVRSTTYDETNVQYIIKDTLLDDLYIVDIKKELREAFASMFNTKSANITISFYPSNKCYFIGDCESNENFDKENSLDTMYSYSKEISLKDYLNLSKTEFYNKYHFKLHIVIRSDSFIEEESYLNNYISDIINKVESLGYKNTSGFEIVLKDKTLLKTIHHVEGEANESGNYSNYHPVND